MCRYRYLNVRPIATWRDNVKVAGQLPTRKAPEHRGQPCKPSDRYCFSLLPSAVRFFAQVASLQAGQHLKPFVLAWRGNAGFAARVNKVRSALQAAGFSIVAEISPYPANAYVDDARILVFTSPALKRYAARSTHGGFAAAQRVAITRNHRDIQVAYTNPVYMAYAYRLKNNLADIAARLANVLGKLETFGSAHGLTKQRLREYHYTFGMEYFDNPYRLAKYASYDDALKQVEKHLADNTVGIRQAYRIDIPGKEETVIGVTRSGSGTEGRYHDDHWIMGNVDFGELHTTAYLPYEIMVTGEQVIGLHMRFRIALYHPDLKMRGDNSLMDILPGAGALGEAMAIATGGTSSPRKRSQTGRPANKTPLH